MFKFALNVKPCMGTETIKKVLDNLYLKYSKKHSSADPIWNLHNFSSVEDIEIIALISSCYAYGQVDLINNFISKLIQRIGNKPHEFTINFSKRKDKKYLEGLNYRFHKDSDLIRLFHSLNAVLKSFGSLEDLFLQNYSVNDLNVIPALSAFTKAIIKNAGTSNIPQVKDNNSYFNFLLPIPEHGSTCKRLMLFLRWMVRKDEIDFGIWKRIRPSKLIIPVDTHISRVAKKLRFVKRKSVDLKFAVELTETLKQFDPDDPVKYDFSLCHYQMEKGRMRISRKITAR